MPRWKWLGNRLLTGIENRAFRRSWSEYHTGYRAFSTDLLRSIAFLRNDDGFVFDQQVFAQLVASGARVVELPIPTRYFHEASSVPLATSVELRPAHAGGARRASACTRRGGPGPCCARPPRRGGASAPRSARAARSGSRSRSGLPRSAGRRA